MPCIKSGQGVRKMDLLSPDEINRLKYKIKNNPDIRKKIETMFEDYQTFIRHIEEIGKILPCVEEIEKIIPILKKYAQEIKKEFEI